MSRNPLRTSYLSLTLVAIIPVRNSYPETEGFATTVSEKKTAWHGVQPVQPRPSALLGELFAGTLAECFGCSLQRPVRNLNSPDARGLEIMIGESNYV
jgi:hypothetical protein